jgi:hypothetical protein
MPGYRGETKPRRQPVRHHIEMFAASHRAVNPTDPFPPLSSAQFPALYVRAPIKNLYRQYMNAKSAYKKSKVA